ncbi:MAG: DUF1638 domain-containing protein [Caldilineaceae bacterium]
MACTTRRWILRAKLQAEIDATVGQRYDAIVLAYGLCGQATAELVSQGYSTW